MEIAKPFFDLCINSKVEAGGKFYEFAKKCVEFGYKTIAIDHVYDVTELKKQNKKNVVIPPPIPLSAKNLDLTVLHRLTVICQDKDILNNVMNHPNFNKYHIFAVIAKNTDMNHHLCDRVDADIIAFDPLDIKGVKISRKSYNKAVNRGLHFELKYFPAIIDQNCRKNIITRSHIYHMFGKSQNIIITSGANSVVTLRGPYDVINLGLIFGLTEQAAHYSINRAGVAVLKHAMSRKIGKALMSISFKNDNKKKSDICMEIDSDSSDSDEVNAVQPVQKKLKTSNDNNIILIDP